MFPYAMTSIELGSARAGNVYVFADYENALIDFPLSFALSIDARRCGSLTGNLRSNAASSRLKTAVLAPIPSARHSSAAAVKPGLLRKVRAV